ncbi:DNA polymerase-like [Mercurialis annua]|uniref:DNA polymerase-like n=1 Tax=Mercurialis annua TaxID=3986 RepID=UPI00215FCF0E|nr:DNA polymerase-like [Mercurialis annua]
MILVISNPLRMPPALRSIGMPPRGSLLFIDLESRSRSISQYIHLSIERYRSLSLGLSPYLNMEEPTLKGRNNGRERPHDLVLRISRIVRREKETLTIYFHNFSRFDGILLLKHLACHHKDKRYTLKPLMRNNRLYELAVYSGKKMLFRFRDSLNLLPGKLSSLAKNLCPELGPKGSIPYEEVTLSNLVSLKTSLLDYMKQGILLLGGVMQKAQGIYWVLYKEDIESKITLSSLALSIFRMKYYDSKNWPIHIPNKNEDCFIRRAYYGGHRDTYKPYGEDLYYYDVNSLYPFVMKEFPMPSGVPVWHGNLEGKDLDSIFGFIEAYVVCPKTIKRPFLPHRDKKNTLIFPTGEFVGVYYYYSEELKYARGLGYIVLPISGYLFERMESPFKDFVSSLFESRLEARKEGNEALAYVYKILMNSLYGRFGINPKSTTTEVCDENRYKYLIRHSELIFGDMLSENNYIVAYHSNTETGSDYWNPSKHSAVQLAAAITASARIYMYPYISREDCYYTDTDSVVLGHPLPEEVISSSVLGKFKLEDRVMKGYFLAPKSYFYIAIDGTNVLKYKGPAKNQVYPEWFESQYADPSRTELVPVEANFRIDWHTLNIIKKDTLVKLGIKLGAKRIPVYHRDVWVDTDPIDVKDLSCLDHIGKQIIKSLRNDVIQLQTEKNLLNEKFSQKEREIAERYKEMKSQFDADKNTDTDKRMHTTEIRTEDEEEPTDPTLDEKTKTDEDF